MTMPSLPAQGSAAWYTHYTAVHNAAAAVTDGRLTDAAVAAASVAAVEGAPSVSPTGAWDFAAPPTVGGSPIGGSALNVKAYGAVGDGVTDDSAAFAAVAAAAKAALRTPPAGFTYTDKLGTVVIDIPPGDYRIVDPGSLLGDEAMTQKGVGLRFQGAGKTITNLVFAPAAAGIMASNNYWQALEFVDIGLRAATAGCTFLQTNTTNAAQRYLFRSVTFEAWKYGFDLRGNDNNSEYTFIDVHTLFHQNDGVFFYVGTTGNTTASDQFVNYWFYGCTHWGTQAPFIDAAWGGSFHIYGLDVSGWGSGATSIKYLFNVRGYSHSLGVCNLEVTGLRVEAMHATNARLLYSEWPQGNITFRNVDLSSQTSTYTYGDMIYLDVENTDSATVAFYDSQLAGGVRVKMAPNTYAHNHLIKFEGCTWLQKNSPSDVVSYDTSATSGNTLPLPPVQFIGCRGLTNDAMSAGGFSVWDACIGYRGQLVQDLKARTLSVRGTYGTPATGSVLTVTLPVGALITGFQALSPAGGGGVTEADGGSWALATTDTTPVTVATATVAGAMSAGYDVTAAVTPPFECTTAAKAKLTITPANVAQWNFSALLLIKGYW